MKMKEWMNCNVYRVVGRLKKKGLNERNCRPMGGGGECNCMVRY